MKRKAASEFVGTAFLLAIVCGSGIMGEALAQGNGAIALLANSIATGAGLYALIQCLGPVSGAHFNPVVSAAEALWGRLGHRALLAYWAAQLTGAVTGVFVAHLMFGLDVFQRSAKDRNHPNLWFSELVATFGLLCVVGLAGRRRVEAAPASIALYVTAAYWFTSSTAFANPAVTLARTLTNTFCGIAPPGAPAFLLAEAIGGALAFLFLGFLTPGEG